MTEGKEPDARFLLANERTLLAYVRTSLAFVAGALAFQELMPGETTPVRRLGALALVAFGATIVGGGFLRWRAADRALRRGEQLPVSVMPVVVAVGAAILVLAAVVIIAT